MPRAEGLEGEYRVYDAVAVSAGHLPPLRAVRVAALGVGGATTVFSDPPEEACDDFRGGGDVPTVGPGWLMAQP